MSRRILGVIAGFAVACGLGPAADGQQTEQRPPVRVAPLFTGTALPDPPKQGAPWTPPETKLPPACVSAVQALRKYGFADPRGCEYRNVELTYGDVWHNRGSLLQTRAWVLPANGAAEAQRFAVSWSGLVYPVVTLGEPADLKADVAELTAKPPPRAGLNARVTAELIAGNAPGERDLLLPRGPNTLKLGLLLVLGETEAAEQMWENRLARATGGPAADPYLSFVHPWAWAHYDRAVCAHIRGDDVISLLGAQTLVRVQESVERDAEARGIPRGKDSQGRPQAYLTYLHNVDRLAADQERRVNAERVQRVLDAGLDKFPDQRERIAALIRDLEEVNSTQDSQPGSVSLNFHPIVRALVQEGEAAVEPLIDCFENDARLTRSVGFGRSFHTGRYFLGVDDAAFTALREILKVRTFGPHTQHTYPAALSSGERRADEVREIRAYWNRMKQHSEVERWYQTLADDQATGQQWLEAAKKIVRPVPLEGARPPSIVTALLPPRELSGEALREKQDPSVTELLARRADQLPTHNEERTLTAGRLTDACEMALALAKWEPDHAGPVLRRRIADCRAGLASGRLGSNAYRVAMFLSQVTAEAIALGDGAAAEEYAAWVQTVRPEPFGSFREPGVFYALYRNPDHPTLAAAARAVFLDEASPWRPLHTATNSMRFRALLDSSLIGVPAFREMVQQGLRNTDPAEATLTVNAEAGSYTIRFGSGAFGGAAANAADPALATAPGTSELRVCDLYAWRVGGLEGAPVFEPYWPQQRRDEAIAELASFLDHWGDRYQPLADVRPDGPRVEARFQLPRLDRPATAEDVEQGRAIFALSGAEVRPVELPQFPQMARWTTLDKFPLGRPGQAPDQIRFDRAGYVWQAEEALVDGKRQRFYGFVGNHIIAKVPAEEIEFLEKIGDEPRLRW